MRISEMIQITAPEQHMNDIRHLLRMQAQLYLNGSSSETLLYGIKKPA
jgi:hypothetical protein